MKEINLLNYILTLGGQEAKWELSSPIQQKCLIKIFHRVLDCRALDILKESSLANRITRLPQPLVESICALDGSTENKWQRFVSHQTHFRNNPHVIEQRLLQFGIYENEERRAAIFLQELLTIFPEHRAPIDSAWKIHLHNLDFIALDDALRNTVSGARSPRNVDFREFTCDVLYTFLQLPQTEKILRFIWFFFAQLCPHTLLSSLVIRFQKEYHTIRLSLYPEQSFFGHLSALLLREGLPLIQKFNSFWERSDPHINNELLQCMQQIHNKGLPEQLHGLLLRAAWRNDLETFEDAHHLYPQEFVDAFFRKDLSFILSGTVLLWERIDVLLLLKNHEHLFLEDVLDKSNDVLHSLIQRRNVLSLAWLVDVATKNLLTLILPLETRIDERILPHLPPELLCKTIREANDPYDLGEKYAKQWEYFNEAITQLKQSPANHDIIYEQLREYATPLCIAYFMCYHQSKETAYLFRALPTSVYCLAVPFLSHEVFAELLNSLARGKLSAYLPHATYAQLRYFLSQNPEQAFSEFATLDNALKALEEAPSKWHESASPLQLLQLEKVIEQAGSCIPSYLQPLWKQKFHPPLNALKIRMQCIEERASAFSKELSPPPELKCPITRDLMKSPVRGTWPDGHSEVYERQAITEWRLRHNASPLTRRPLEEASFSKDESLSKRINTFRI